MLRPRWLVIHALLVVSCAAMVVLGKWQWDVGEAGGSGEGSLLNYGYALQWWVFTGFAVFVWTRLMRDDRRRRAVAGNRIAPLAGTATGRERTGTRAPTRYRGYAMPQMAQVTDSDPELAAYNAYLGGLNPVRARPATAPTLTAQTPTGPARAAATGAPNDEEPATAAEGER